MQKENIQIKVIPDEMEQKLLNWTTKEGIKEPQSRNVVLTKVLAQ